MDSGSSASAANRLASYLDSDARQESFWPMRVSPPYSRGLPDIEVQHYRSGMGCSANNLFILFSLLYLFSEGIIIGS